MYRLSILNLDPDVNEAPHGFELLHHIWTRLNRICTGHGRCRDYPGLLSDSIEHIAKEDNCASGSYFVFGFNVSVDNNTQH